MPPLNFVDQCAHKLLEGVDAAKVMLEVRAHYNTSCSLRHYTSSIRRRALELLDPKKHAMHSSFHQTFKEFQQEVLAAKDHIPHNLGVKATVFINATPTQKVQILKAHKKHPVFNYPPLDMALSRIRVVPENVQNLHISYAESQSCKKEQEDVLMQKHTSVRTVYDVSGVVKMMIDTLEFPERAKTPALICALIMASGRRISEICNGVSTFKACEGFSHAALFTGQLKTRAPRLPLDEGQEVKPYVIPLLVPFDIFDNAMIQLRRIQSKRHGNSKGHVTERDNQHVANRYDGSVNKYAREFYGVTSSHPLRALYAQLGFIMFVTTGSILDFIRKSLGHQSIATSLNYMYVAAESFPASILIPDGKLTLPPDWGVHEKDKATRDTAAVHPHDAHPATTQLGYTGRT